MRIFFLVFFFFVIILHPPRSTLFPYTTLFRSRIATSFALSTQRETTRVWRTPSPLAAASAGRVRSEEHTSELQSQSNLVCRLLLEKKKANRHIIQTTKIDTPHFII